MNKGRIAVRGFGHIDPLLAAPDVLRFKLRRNTESHRISLAENNKC
jgi:hypothetical protein